MQNTSIINNFTLVIQVKSAFSLEGIHTTTPHSNTNSPLYEINHYEYLYVNNIHYLGFMYDNLVKDHAKAKHILEVFQ